jgi:hypothetical protein
MGFNQANMTRAAVAGASQNVFTSPAGILGSNNSAGKTLLGS